MSARLYADVHVHRAIVVELKVRGVDVLRAQEDGAERLPDDELLNRSTGLGRVLLTYDDDLLAIATVRQRTGVPFGGIIFARERDLQIGKCIDELETLLLAGEPDDFADIVTYLTFPSSARQA